ncbi:MAG: zinc-binding dehydrogenase, partial [Candidatus Latescibacteria bacterium]|nr:zinc-binding dehydrogenase [Candidatus Latescibacterota bacterium]
AVALGPLFGARVVGLGNSSVRLDMAREMGAHEALLSDDPELEAKLDEFTHGQGIDLVILTANPWPAYRTAMEVVRTNGRVSVVSLPGRGEEPLDFNPLDMRWFYFKGVSLCAVNDRAGSLFPPPEGDHFDNDGRCVHVLSLMQEGKLQPSRLVTRTWCKPTKWRTTARKTCSTWYSTGRTEAWSCCRLPMPTGGTSSR